MINLYNIRHHLYFLLVILASTIASHSGKAQDPDQEKRPVQVPIFGVQGATLFPGGDFADRFGFHANVGGSFTYKTRSNWIFGVEGDFIFGPNVRENNLLDDLMTDNGFLVGLDGNLYNPILYLRGIHFRASIEKILPFWQKNVNSGPVIRLSGGFLQHKIYYDVKQRGNLPQISKERIKGYDRLSNGLSTTQFLGYHYMSDNRLINFSIGLEVTQAFTQNRRSFNHDTGLADPSNRLDISWGLRARWFLPLYKKRVIDFNQYYE